mmetsp:Transcript_3738/g.8652  ORF Transcript_3738/g.8652 Transcript_3738/m.8652 type:complete len:285 (+) Transcript_3738:133-987(+)
MEWGCIESIRFAPHRTIDMVRALMRDASSSSLEYSRVLVGIPHKVARDHRGGSARGGGHLPEGPFVVSIGEVEKKGLDEGPGGYQNNRCLNDAEGGLYKGPPDQSEEKGEDHSQKRHQNIGRVGAGILRWNLAGSWLWFFRCLLRCVLWGIGSGRGGLFLRSGIRSWWFLRFLRLRLLLLLLPFLLLFEGRYTSPRIVYASSFPPFSAASTGHRGALSPPACPGTLGGFAPENKIGDGFAFAFATALARFAVAPGCSVTTDRCDSFKTTFWIPSDCEANESGQP